MNLTKKEKYILLNAIDRRIEEVEENFKMIDPKLEKGLDKRCKKEKEILKKLFKKFNS